jgi:enoyl-CoA hydratase/carnithine racemase
LIRVEHAGGLRLVWLDRPFRRNALTLGMVESIRDLLLEAAADRRVQSVILAGVGPSFCSGVDLHEFAGGTVENAQTLITALADACAAALACPKPVAVAIHGHCLGGGLELACACDFRVASPDARLGMPEVGLGISSVIHAALIQRHAGLGRAQELLLTGESIEADTALEWGLVNRVVEQDALLDTCRDLIGRVIRHDPEAIARQKRLLWEWQELPLSQAVDRSRAELVESFATGLPQELARRRLLERR